MKTNIYAITDSHQESRNLSRLLSGIYNFEKNSNKPFLILDAGDLFKGIYDKDLSVNAYLTLKKLLPQAEIIITLGNNDFGFKKSDFEYLKDTVKKFKDAGIKVICANLSPQLVPEYELLNINGERILITGFCLNNSCARKFGYELNLPEESFEKLLNNMQESFDKIIVLNHNWYTYSKNLKDKFPQIDLIIGGHEHSPIPPDFERNIFYPYSFARSMYKITSEKTEEIPVETLQFIPELETPITKYEQKTKLKSPLIKRVLNLTKKYSDSCPLGTFISDNMQKAGNTDIAFHSTGFTMYPLRLEDSSVITKYDMERVICAATNIEKIEITAKDLKKVFENAFSQRMLKDRGNSKFLQCSQNVTIKGVGIKKDNSYHILQIKINGEELLDKDQNLINPNKTYTCTIDHYIGTGEQGFEVLKNLPKTKVLKNGKEIVLNELFYEALKEAEQEFTGDSEYPCFKIIDIEE
ncbi:MAG: 5'-nucleotidase C-terminal domain-containing protein [Candidatus Gastranaerophilales bacterium]|nr:5'-nucleotidase C-terminal domain-containing protein [Candidatus Gastranaerophilales bacterium]